MKHVVEYDEDGNVHLGAAVRKPKTLEVLRTFRGTTDFEIHRPGCADIARKIRSGQAEEGWTCEVPEGVEDIERAFAVDLAGDGFAQDEGISPEEYVDRGWGERAKVLPCTATRQ